MGSSVSIPDEQSWMAMTEEKKAQLEKLFEEFKNNGEKIIQYSRVIIFIYPKNIYFINFDPSYRNDR